MGFDIDLLGPPEEDDTLAHYGVKGMRWGHRKSEVAKPTDIRNAGVRVGADGSIEIDKGASMQRLVRSSGKSLPMKDLTYASINDYDNARYVKTIGGKGLLGGGRDQILSIQATRPIKAPSVDEATRIFSEKMIADPAFRKSVINVASFTGSMTDKEWARIQAESTGKDAKTWYKTANTALTFDNDFAPGATKLQMQIRELYQSKGYNALRDENDVSSGIAKAPIIIFSPEKSLRVLTVTNITDELRAANKEKLRAYKSLGKDWADKRLYK